MDLELLKKRKQSIGKSRGGWNTKLHLVTADDRTVIRFFLTPGQWGDAPQGRELLNMLGPTSDQKFILMDRVYEENATRQLAMDLGYTSVVPPHSNRKNPWEYDKTLYKRRNEVEHLFRRIKRFRRVFTRYDKLDVIFLGFVTFALIMDCIC